MLERLRADDLQNPLSGESSLSAKVFSIKEKLIQLLNSRSGSSTSSLGYGLDDFNDSTIGTSDMMRTVATHIKKTIENYEPRVQNVRVDFNQSRKSNLELYFQISSTIKVKQRAENVTIDIILNKDKIFQVNQ